MDLFYIIIPLSIYGYQYTIANIPDHPDIDTKSQLDYKTRYNAIVNSSIYTSCFLLSYMFNQYDILYYGFAQLIGYFVVDLYYLKELYSVNKLLGTCLFIFHHLAAIYGIYYYIDTHLVLLARIFICEISSIFLNSTWILYKSNNADHILFKPVGVLTILTYFITRIVNFTHLIFTINIHPHDYYIVIWFTIVNYYWFYKIINMYISVN